MVHNGFWRLYIERYAGFVTGFGQGSFQDRSYTAVRCSRNKIKHLWNIYEISPGFQHASWVLVFWGHFPPRKFTYSIARVEAHSRRILRFRAGVCHVLLMCPVCQDMMRSAYNFMERLVEEENDVFKGRTFRMIMNTIMPKQRGVCFAHSL